jgi:hydroxypyruvate isomerase
LRFDVNCSILFTELPLLERPAAAKAAGFDGVEFWWPFDEPEPGDKEADAFVTAIADAGVDLVSLNFLTGDIAAGERGLLSVPHAKARLRRNIPAAVELATRVGCTRLNAPYGNRLAPGDAKLAREPATSRSRTCDWRPTSPPRSARPSSSSRSTRSTCRCSRSTPARRPQP